MKEMNRTLFNHGLKTLKTINDLYNTMEEGCVRIIEGSKMDEALSELWFDSLDVMTIGLGIEDGDWQEVKREIFAGIAVFKQVNINGLVITEDDLIDKLSGDEAEEVWEMVKEAMKNKYKMDKDFYDAFMEN